MGIKEYNQKRRFNHTPEPEGVKEKGESQLRFVVQKHAASHLHYDFRLELDGVLKSWAVPKGPSLDPKDQRLAVHVEDHPISYRLFEGIIPKNNYGAGSVIVWDKGTYTAWGDKTREVSEPILLKGLEKGHLTFILNGSKLKGEFALIRLKESKNWLLIKKRDAFANPNVVFSDRSILSGRTLKEIETGSEAMGEVWISEKPNDKRDKRTKMNPISLNLKSEREPKPERFPLKLKPAFFRKISFTSAQIDAFKNIDDLKHLPDDLPNYFPKDFKNWWLEQSPIGIRVFARVDGARTHLYSKYHLSFNQKYSFLRTELSRLQEQLWIEGQLCDGVYYVYDLLHHNGMSLRNLALWKRKKALKALSIYSKLIVFLPHVELSAPSLYKELNSKHSKNPTYLRHKKSLYPTGPSPFWLQLDCASSKPFESVKFTHLNKLYWPTEKITKGEVIDYYRSVSPLLLPHLKGHPQSLHRHPNGIGDSGFFQKDLSGHHPSFVKTERIFSPSVNRSIDYLLCQNEETLLYMANLGCLEIHPWLSRIENLDHPQGVVIDLDPDENPFSSVVRVASEIRKILEKIEVKSFCKTSGSRGLHIWIPTLGSYSYDETRHFALDICQRIQTHFPDLTSLERTPARRKKKIYLDCFQNAKGQTLAAPYCLRPRPKAPISTPLEWTELHAKLDPTDFHIRNILKRLEKRGDLWAESLTKKINLTDASLKLNQLFPIKKNGKERSKKN